MNWGQSVFAVYLGFAAFMLGLVTLCIKQDDIFLVDKQYYKQELQYQQQLDQMNNAARLSTPVDFRQAEGWLTIGFPQEAMPSQGTLHLFRPSNANLDRRLAVQANAEGAQMVNLGSLQPGLWKLKLQWQSQGKPYYAEHALVVR